MECTVPKTVQLYGIDPCTKFFPSSVSRIPNMHFLPHSVTDLPASWTNRFNFVNQRLLLAALTNADWTRALSELHRVLAPGGHIQLGEVTDWCGPNASAAQRRHFAALDALGFGGFASGAGEMAHHHAMSMGMEMGAGALHGGESPTRQQRVRIALKSAPAPGGEGGEWEVEVC